MELNLKQTYNYMMGYDTLNSNWCLHGHAQITPNPAIAWTLSDLTQDADQHQQALRGMR